MKEAAAIGVPPHRFWKLTLRELYAAFSGHAVMEARTRQRSVFHAWMGAHYGLYGPAGKKLPKLPDELRKWEHRPRPRKMSNQSLRKAIIAAAILAGANVVGSEQG